MTDEQKRKRLERLKAELTWTDSLNILRSLIGNEKVDKGIESHKKEITQLQHELPHICGACGGTLSIGDVICKACVAGPYQEWCDENNISEEDR